VKPIISYLKAKELETQMADKASKAEIQNIGNASPKGVYATLSALQTAFPTGTTGIYLVTADGKWYYWSGSAWTTGGTYQSTGIADGSINPEQTTWVSAIRSKNIYNKDDVFSGKTVNDGAGLVLSDNANKFASNYIPVKPNTSYVISHMSDVGFQSTSAIYQINSAKTSGSAINYAISNNTSFSTNSTAAYIRVVSDLREINLIQIEQGSTPTAYVDYTSIVNINIPNLQFPSLQYKTPKDLQDNILLLKSDVAALKNSNNSGNPVTKQPIIKHDLYVDKTADYATQTSVWETSLITNPNTFYAKVQSAGGALNDYYRYNIRMQEAGSTFPLYQTVNGQTSTSNQTSDVTVEFMTDATQMELIFRATTNWVHVIADNELVAKLTVTTDRNLITFPSKKIRHIRLLCQSNLRFAGIAVDTRSNVWKCSDIRKKIAIDGDSIAWGANNNGQGLNSPAGVISQTFDWDFYVNAMGGTGYVADSNGTSIPIMQRIQGLIDEKPDVILILNGLNDTSATYLQTLDSKVNDYFIALKTNFPTSDIIICSPFNPKGDLVSVPYIQEVEAVIRGKALAFNLPYIDLLRGNTYDKNGTLVTSALGGIITGTGSVANVQPTGNASVYMSSDTTHTSPDGGRYLGMRIAEEMYKILNAS
jgi:hypothetical protein